MSVRAYYARLSRWLWRCPSRWTTHDFRRLRCELNRGHALTEHHRWGVGMGAYEWVDERQMAARYSTPIGRGHTVDPTRSSRLKKGRRP